MTAGVLTSCCFKTHLCSDWQQTETETFTSHISGGSGSSVGVQIKLDPDGELWLLTLSTLRHIRTNRYRHWPTVLPVADWLSAQISSKIQLLHYWNKSRTVSSGGPVSEHRRLYRHSAAVQPPLSWLPCVVMIPTAGTSDRRSQINLCTKVTFCCTTSCNLTQRSENV